MTALPNIGKKLVNTMFFSVTGPWLHLYSIAPHNCLGMHYIYLCTYDLYGPVRNAFDAARIKSITHRAV